MPDRLLGEAIKAFVVPADPADPPGREELRAFARAALAGFKVPAQWEFVPSLPRNATGKLLRRQLHAEEMMAEFRSESGADVTAAAASRAVK